MRAARRVVRPYLAAPAFPEHAPNRLRRTSSQEPTGAEKARVLWLNSTLGLIVLLSLIARNPKGHGSISRNTFGQKCSSSIRGRLHLTRLRL